MFAEMLLALKLMVAVTCECEHLSGKGLEVLTDSEAVFGGDKERMRGM